MLPKIKNMTRVKRGSVATLRRKKILKLTKGFVGSHSKLFATANQQSMKAHKYAYNDRRKRKSQYNRLWIVRINALARLKKKTYSYERYESKQLKIILNRKMLAEDNLRTFFFPLPEKTKIKSQGESPKEKANKFALDSDFSWEAYYAKKDFLKALKKEKDRKRKEERERERQTALKNPKLDLIREESLKQLKIDSERFRNNEIALEPFKIEEYLKKKGVDIKSEPEREKIKMELAQFLKDWPDLYKRMTAYKLAPDSDFSWETYYDKIDFLRALKKKLEEEEEEKKQAELKKPELDLIREEFLKKLEINNERFRNNEIALERFKIEEDLKKKGVDIESELEREKIDMELARFVKDWPDIYGRITAFRLYGVTLDVARYRVLKERAKAITERRRQAPIQKELERYRIKSIEKLKLKKEKEMEELRREKELEEKCEQLEEKYSKFEEDE